VTGGLNAQVAMNARGDMVVAWQHGNGAATTVQAAVRPQGGSFSAPVTVAAAGETAAAPQVGIDGTGNAAVLWRRDVAGKGTVRAALRPAGGEFGAPVDVSAAGEDAGAPQLALSAGGIGVVTWVRQDGAHKLLRALTRSAAGALSGPVDVSSSSEDAQQPSAAIDAAGNAIVVWIAGGIVKRAEEPAGGSFTAPARLSAIGEVAIVPDVSVGDGGAAIATWAHGSAGGWVPRAAVRAPGSAFADPVDVAPGGGAGSQTTVAMNARGDAVLTWESADNFKLGVRASVRPAAGAFSDPPLNVTDDGAVPAATITPAGDVFLTWRDFQGTDAGPYVRVRGARLRAGASALTESKIISPSSGDDEDDYAQLASDGAGDAVAVWRPVGMYTGLPPDGVNISTGTIGVSVFDVIPPQLTGVSVPSAGIAGTPVAASATATDTWSPTTTVQFDFGDGSSQTGATVSHSYTTAGTYTVTVTATDGAGNTTAGTRAITVAAAPDEPPPPSTNTNHNPPPTGNPPPGPAGPTAAQIKSQLLAQITPTGAATKLAKLAKAKRYALRYTALTTGTATITWTAKSAGTSIVIATGTRRFTSGGAATVEIKLTAKGVKLLKHAKSLKVTATSSFTAQGAAPVTATKTFTLKR
jgi:PKD repeat protein